MGLLMNKPWRLLNADEVATVGGWTGVYELADAEGNVLMAGYAGGRSLFGLRGELERHLRDREPGVERFRVEVTTAYLTRWRELLMAHVGRDGAVPPLNREQALPGLGRLSVE
jgi:hypothetical protein